MQITLKFYCKSYKKSNLSMSESFAKGNLYGKLIRKLISDRLHLQNVQWLVNSSVKKNIFKLVIKSFSN